MGFEVVANLEDIEIGHSVKVVAGGEPIALARLDATTVKAVHNTCSHADYDLAPEGYLEDNTIECLLHGSVFDLDTGEPDSLPAVKPIPVYATKIEDGKVYVDVEQQLNDAPAPRHY
ncbi:MAG TPA: non-heme iron oxygenase ferredoxin subunit [Egibacteraceae bacterium]|jgi:3-phenylpropionate/trans-cinnamate dioxygenase ferredoxin component|nr:non-heme iron oxygenase ferredoxin subunit [Egibacteraceae bacterium]